METKRWYQSKLVWLGVLQTLIGIAGLFVDFFGAGDSTPQAITMLLAGALTVIMRVWFTDTKLV